MSILPRLAALCLVLPVLAGCYTYAATDLSAVAADARVRARLAPDEAERLEAVLGSDRRLISGRVAEVHPDELVLAVSVPVTSPGGSITQRLQQRVIIPRAAIREVELRRLHRARTAGLVLGSAALLGFIAYEAFVREDPAGPPGEEPPPSNEQRRPAGFSIPLPW